MVLRRVAVGLSALLLASGCSSGDEPPEVAPSQASTETTSAPSPAASLSPAPKEPSAKESIRAWIAAYNSAITGAELRRFERISKACEDCMSIVRRFNEIYAAGGHVDGGILDLRGLRRIPDMGGDQAWRARVVVEPATYRESADGVLEELTGGTSSYRFVVTPGDFTITDLFVESS